MIFIHNNIGSPDHISSYEHVRLKMTKKMQSIYGTMGSQIHGPRYLETRKQLESGREMGWVPLGHIFSCGGECNYTPGKAGYMLLVTTIVQY